MQKKINVAGGFGEMKRSMMKRGTSYPASAKIGKLNKAAEITYGRLIEEAGICWRQGKAQEATLLLRKAIAVNTNHSEEVYYNLGLALQRQGDLQAAIDAYRQALAIKPTCPTSLNNLGAALREQGDLQAAVDSYQKALAFKPDYPQAYHGLGLALQEQGDLQAAIASYQKALAFKSDYPQVYYNLGLVLQEQGDLQAAIASYQKALAFKPDYPQVNLNLSLVQLLIGNYEDGWDLYEWRFRREKGSIQP
ncbi:MAG: tetratricopeptide repeat protein, partial [Synechococcus sp. SB0666_bin_14]|nr:tetratricopeptide repeat protein [Synechococcus sp. SB0666_bin_14]MYG47360.1 tetratricopeptide repeat protein [Synechococcus sp. SB0675_bin_6]